MIKLSMESMLRTGSAAACLCIALTPQLGIAQAAEDEFFDLGTIEIEARRRPEDLVDVPVAVTVVDDQAIRLNRSDDLEDLARTVVGYEQPNYGDDPRTAQPIIRGIGPLSTLLSPDNATTPVIIDGVPMPAFGASGQLLNIDQVEILRGPQGTLFGRNSTGGAVIINSRRPDGFPELRFNAEAGTDSYGKLEVMGGNALTDTVSARGALRLLRQDGYIENDHPDEDDIGGYNIGAFTGTIAWDPSDRTSLTFTLSGEVDERDTGYPILLRDENAFQETPLFKREQLNMALNLRQTFDNFELHSVTGLTRYEVKNTTDNTDGNLFSVFLGVPASGFINDGEFNMSKQRENQAYQELRLQSLEGASISWTTGIALSANNYDEEASGSSNLFSTVNGTRDVNLKTRSQGIFTDVTIPFANQFELGTGVRYTRETKEIDASFTGNGFAGTVASFEQNDQQTFDFFTGRMSLSYRPNEASLIYGTISKGAKAGGYPRFTNNASFGRPETGYAQTDIVSYELGTKTEVLAGRGFVSMAAFFNDVENEAVFTYDRATNTFPIESFDTESYGVEVEGIFALTDGLDLRAGAAWIETEITGLQDGTAFPAALGQDIPNVPDIAGSLALDYFASAAFIGMPDEDFRSQFAVRYVGERAVDPNNSFSLDQMISIDGRISLTRGDAEIYVFGENLLDEQFEQQGSLIATGVESVVRSRGRTLGVGLTMTF